MHHSKESGEKDRDTGKSCQHLSSFASKIHITLLADISYVSSQLLEETLRGNWWKTVCGVTEESDGRQKGNSHKATYDSYIAGEERMWSVKFDVHMYLFDPIINKTFEGGGECC